MSFNREDVQRRLDRRRARGACHIADTDLTAALVEIDRLDGNLKDVLQNKLKPLQQELRRAYKSTARQRERAEQAEARAAALQSELDAAWFGIERSFEIEPREVIEREAKSNGFKFGLAQAVHTIWKREPKVADALNRAERLTEALRWYQERAESVRRYLDQKNDDASVAVMTELDLDAGKRAAAALREEA